MEGETTAGAAAAAAERPQNGAAPPPPPEQEFKALRAALAAAVQALKAAPMPPLVATRERSGASTIKAQGQQDKQQQQALDVPALGRAVLAALPPDTAEERARWAGEGTSSG